MASVAGKLLQQVQAFAGKASSKTNTNLPLRNFGSQACVSQATMPEKSKADFAGFWAQLSHRRVFVSSVLWEGFIRGV